VNDRVKARPIIDLALQAAGDGVDAQLAAGVVTHGLADAKVASIIKEMLDLPRCVSELNGSRIVKEQGDLLRGKGFNMHRFEPWREMRACACLCVW